MSQLALALQADVSARHLSFVETGRAQPGRELILRLAEELDVPLRERNALLVAAGFAPVFEARAFDDPAFDGIRAIVDLTLARHEPFPAYLIDRHWNVVRTNAAVPSDLRRCRCSAGTAAHQRDPPGAAPRRAGTAALLNHATWRSHYLAQLRRQIQMTADPRLELLLREVLAYPGPTDSTHGPSAGPAVPLVVQYPSRAACPSSAPRQCSAAQPMSRSRRWPSSFFILPTHLPNLQSSRQPQALTDARWSPVGGHSVRGLRHAECGRGVALKDRLPSTSPDLSEARPGVADETARAGIASDQLGERACGSMNPQHLKLLSGQSDLYRHLITLAFAQHGPAQRGFAADDLNG